MQAYPAKVIEYFNGEKQSLIPLFQRAYSWKKSNWQTLWDDMMVQYDLGEDSTHFMGAIVSLPAYSVPVGVNKFLIIDGQQRLTTVSLLLCALRDKLGGNTAARLQDVYLTNPYRDEDDRLKFVPTQVDRAIYRGLVLDHQAPADGGLIVDAYRFFIEQLTDGLDPNGDQVDPKKVLSTVERALQVVMINLGESDDPYLIFESLNFKGEPLSQADLVRNYIVMRFHHSIAPGGEQERVYNKYWLPLEAQLGTNVAEFLRHYAMKDGDDIRQGGIYAAVKQKLKGMETPEKVEAEMASMQVFGQYYGKILLLGGEADAQARRRLENIKELKVTTSYPLLLRLFDARTSGALNPVNFEKCLALVESFVVRRAICGVPTNALNKLFLQWAKIFPADKHVAWLNEQMTVGGASRRFPKDPEFAVAFTTQPQYGRGSTRFILSQLEWSFGNGELIDLAKTIITIEHVMPQTLSQEWKDELGPGAEAMHSRLVDTFGNLTLTSRNSELGNLPFAEKKAKLLGTHIDLNFWILEQAHWHAAEIEARAQKLLTSAIELWPGPLVHGA